MKNSIKHWKNAALIACLLFSVSSVKAQTPGSEKVKKETAKEMKDRNQTGKTATFVEPKKSKSQNQKSNLKVSEKKTVAPASK